MPPKELLYNIFDFFTRLTRQPLGAVYLGPKHYRDVMMALGMDHHSDFASDFAVRSDEAGEYFKYHGVEVRFNRTLDDRLCICMDSDRKNMFNVDLTQWTTREHLVSFEGPDDVVSTRKVEEQITFMDDLKKI